MADTIRRRMMAMNDTNVITPVSCQAVKRSQPERGTLTGPK
jgi:hypothetical protein